MSEPALEYFVNADGVRIAYRRFGRGPETLVCVHGLYRSGRDFDVLARALADRFQVILPDMMGRGDSEPAPDPSRYNAEYYARDVLGLATALGLDGFHYLGTSMGGLVGMGLMARPDTPVRKLVLNDVGPEVKLSVLREIGQRSLDAPTEFPDYARAAAYLRSAFRDWGPLAPDQLEHLIRYSLKEEDGRWRFRYDRDLILGFRWPPGDLDLWDRYRAFPGPVLVIRGASSPVLSAETADKLRAEPRTRVYEVAGAAHAPSLMSEDQIRAIREFLEA